MARYWLSVTLVSEYRMAAAPNCLTRPQRHGVLPVASIIRYFEPFIRQRCCRMARCWWRVELMEISFSSLLEARNYTIPTQRHGRSPATSICRGRFTPPRYCRMVRSLSSGGSTQMKEVQFTIARSYTIPPLEFGPILVDYPQPGATTPPRCWPMV